MFCTYAFTISLIWPYFDFRMFYARWYPSVVKGTPSMAVLTLGPTSSLRYENWFQKRGQSVNSPLNLVMTSFGNLSLFTGAAYAATWPMLLFLASSIFFSNSSFCSSCAHSNCSCLTLSRPALLLISLLPNLLYNWFERVFAINTWFPRQPLLVVPQLQRFI